MKELKEMTKDELEDEEIEYCLIQLSELQKKRQEYVEKIKWFDITMRILDGRLKQSGVTQRLQGVNKEEK